MLAMSVAFSMHSTSSGLSFMHFSMLAARLVGSVASVFIAAFASSGMFGSAWISAQCTYRRSSASSAQRRASSE